MVTELPGVVALGASTPLGRDPWSSTAAVHAGISAFTSHPFMIHTGGERMGVALAPWLDVSVTGTPRMQALLFPALDQALEPLTAHAGPRAAVALALALPAPRPGLPSDLDRSLANAVFARYPDVFTTAASFPNGHAAGLLALAAACQRFASGTLDACVVAGVDSYLSAETLEWLEGRDQLHGAGIRQNPWGFIPGEAASALLIATAEYGERLGAKPLARVLGIGTATEPNRLLTQTVCIGDGLTQALRLALRSLPAGETISDMYSDMNGEPYRADEFGFSALRIMKAFSENARMWTPADCWGDVGAVSGPLSVVLAACDTAPSVPRPLTLVWSSSEDGHRAAAVLRPTVQGH